MADLCNLELMVGGGGGSSADHWPANIDERIAQLEFSTSSSILALSTDSLDMEKLRQRCETNKYDYKLTFEDSGQWTTSGFGTATSPSGPIIDEKERNADLLLNNDEPPNGTLTNWGRIRSAEPFDAKTNSMPSADVAFRSTNSNEQRPTSLLANFVERQSAHDSNSPPRDYEYSEQYIGDDRYVDLNENEIGFVPPDSSALRHSTRPPPVPSTFHSDRWRDAHQSSSRPTRRTFAQLSRDYTAPDLNFLSLPFKMPSFCRSSASLDNILRHTKPESALTDCLAAVNLDSCRSSIRLFPQSSLAADGPDSGLGASSMSGPAHIEDWATLSFLLPKSVVEACSFFKSNINLLAERKLSTQTCPDESQLTCKNCFGVQKSLPSSQTQPSFYNSSVGTPKEKRQKLNTDELGVIGTPVYNKKRQLVESAVTGVAEIARGGSPNVLIEGLVALLSDGLRPNRTLWEFIVRATKLGKATESIHELVQRLDSNGSEKPTNSRVYQFFFNLLTEHSLSGWMGYVVQKDRELIDLFDENAFLFRAHTAYRSLFLRLIESLELFSVLQRCERRDCAASRIPSDSRVPKSSSVPSRLSAESVIRSPSLNVFSTAPRYRRRRSKIPVFDSPLRRSRSSHNALSLSTPTRRPTDSLRSRSLLAIAKTAIVGHGPGGWLPLAEGEKVRVLTVKGSWARCCRVERRPGVVRNGAVPTEFLEL